MAGTKLRGARKFWDNKMGKQPKKTTTVPFGRGGMFYVVFLFGGLDDCMRFELVIVQDLYCKELKLGLS